MGPVRYATMGFLAQSLKAFSQACRYVLDGTLHEVFLEHCRCGTTPFFEVRTTLPISALGLSKKGVLAVSDLFDTHLLPIPALLAQLGPAWQTDYNSLLLVVRSVTGI